MEYQLSDKHLFIFGMGFSSKAIAAAAKDDFASICGTSRSLEKAQAIRQSGYGAEIFSGDPTEEIIAQLSKATHIVMSISPGDEDPVLAAFPDLTKRAPKLQWMGYLSTVGVYGHHDGAWVDEDSSLKPVSKRSIQRVAAEEAWQALANTAGIPLGIFRLSGIYGPGRNWFINIEKGKSRRMIKPGQVFNRIHREDIGTAVSNAIALNIDGVFNVTDNEPAPPQDVVTYAHELMGLEPPPEIDFETADISPMARSFYGENKRVSNAKSKSMLKMNYAWPDYRTALERMWKDGSWQSE